MAAWQNMPDMVIGIDFGMTSTAVAYAFGPAWERPENIQQWEGLAVNQAQNKVPSAISYTTDGRVRNWGFGCDYEVEGPETPNDDFKLELDPTYLPNDPNRTPVADVRQWYADYMRSLHDFLARRFDNYSPYWREQKVQWHFSAPTTWKNLSMKRDIQEILGNCGFGLDGRQHTWEISLTEAEAAAIHAAKQQVYRKDDVILVCDAGGGTTDVNILRMDSHPGEPTVLTPLDHDEGREIGSTNIDESFRRWAEERLSQPEVIKHLSSSPEHTARRMVRGHGMRFLSVKCGFYDGAVSQQPAYPLAIPGMQQDPPLNFPEASIEGSKLILTREALQKFFDTEIDRMIDLIDERIDSLGKKHDVDISWLILSGGLGSSGYVRERLCDAYERGRRPKKVNATRMRILQGHGAQTGVSQGLVQDRIQRIKFNQSIFTLKCAQASYGVVVKEKWDPQIHGNCETHFDPLSKITFVLNRIHWIIMKGQPIDTEETFGRKQYWVHVDEDHVYDTRAATIVASTVPVENLPQFFSDMEKSSYEEACRVRFQLPTSQVVRKRRSWWKCGDHFFECIFFIKAIPEMTEIRFQMLTKDGHVCSREDGKVDVEWGHKTAVIPRNRQTASGQLYAPNIQEHYAPQVYRSQTQMSRGGRFGRA